MGTLVDMNDISAINGVRIWTDDNGITHFIPLKDDEQLKTNNEDTSISLWSKIKNWFRKNDVKPYVKIRDLADPLEKRINDPDDFDVGSDGKHSAEIGIKISF